MGWDEYDDANPDPLSAARGCVIALPIALLLDLIALALAAATVAAVVRIAHLY